MIYKSILRVPFHSWNITNKLASIVAVSFRPTDLRVCGRTSRSEIITVTTRTMSDAISEKTGEDNSQNNKEAQKNKEEDRDSGTTSSEDKTIAKEGSSKGKASEEESLPLRYATRKGFFEEHQKTVKETKEKFLSMPIDEKRKLYKCKGKYISLDQIQTWPDLFTEELMDDEDIVKWFKRNKAKVDHEVKESLNEKISLFRGDITALEIDAIANAANESLLGGGGVDGAIHAAAGPHLRSECELLKGCNGGEAKITCGYKLPAKYVIHTVGPRGEKPHVLESCYEQCLNLLKENQLKSLAFPCISTGIFGYPNEAAAIVALRTVRNWLDSEDYAKNIERIIFCLFLEKDLDVYHRWTQIFFPLEQDRPSSTKD